MSRLWNDPALKPDGTLHDAQLTLAEIGEYLAESLMDRVYNGGDQELVPCLDDLPDIDTLPAEAPVPAALVAAMEALLRLENEDAAFRSSRARAVLGIAIRELKQVARGT